MATTIRIVTPGKHEADIIGLLAKYEKRITPFCRISWQLTASGEPKKEHADIMAKLAGAPYIVLDERGHSVTTEHIAKTLQGDMVSGRDLVLVIGGAYGLSEEIRRQARETWSFGNITLPHQLVRLIALEQLYRSVAILTHHPYHHASS